MTHPGPSLPADATTPGLAFHRLVFARQRSGWWTPLVVGALGMGFYLVLTLVVLIVVIIAAGVDPTIMDRLLLLSQNPAIDASDPVMLTLLLGTIVLMLPCYVAASRIVNGRRVGLVSSAAGRLRWGWMLRCALVAVALYAVFAALSLVLPGEEAAAPQPNPQWALSLVLILLLVPFQSAAEEYIFRGYLMQSIGRWLRHPAWAMLLPVPLFMLGHLYDVLGQINVGFFAVAAGWLVWRTGGLEAAIALHVVNNLSGFLISLAAGTDPTDAETGIVSFIASLLLIGGYVAIVEWMLRRKPLPRTLILTAPVVPAQWAPPVQPPAGAVMLSASKIV